MSADIVDTQAVVVEPDQLNWRVNPTIQGGQMAVLTGDPFKSEPDVMRFKFPANRRQPPTRILKQKSSLS